MPSRLRAVPNGAAVAFGSGGNAGKGRIAPGTPARARSSAFGSRYTHCRAAAAWAIVPLYCATDRKSTRLNSSHVSTSYAVFCWKKKIGVGRLHALQHLFLDHLQMGRDLADDRGRRVARELHTALEVEPVDRLYQAFFF